MAAPASLDPFSLVRDVVSQVEKFVNEHAGPVMKSDGFASGANKLMSVAMVAKKLAQDLTQRYLEALNVPSRRDVITLGDRLQALEDRMIGMQSSLDHLSGRSLRSARPTPSRTRKPPSAIEVVAPAASRPAPPIKAAPRRTRKPKP
jgi:hypothetical protein